MKDVVARTWNELTDALYAESWAEGLKRHRSSFIFRGLSNARYPLETNLARLGGDFAALERHLLRNFTKYAHRDAVAHDSFWNWVSLAEHHGLPTRLLDWTYSPFVAMHFATADTAQFDRDGVVWCVDYVAASRHLPGPLRAALDDEGSHIFTTEMLDRIAHDFERLARLSEDEFVVFLEPPSLDSRIVNQYAVFSFMSQAASRFDRWLEARPDLLRRVIVPAALKWEVRDKLDQANVSERVLFPGLDGLSAWLKRHYSPRE